MGSVNLNNLKNTNKSDDGFTYVDLYLDIEEIQVCTGEGSRKITRSDIKLSYDEEAIKNSLINIFNTIPGERFLVPEFGSNLIQYLFRPVTESTARAIGNSILNTVERWEPRITVEHVNVVGIPSKMGVGDHEYHVTVIISIPELKVKTELTGILSQGGFVETQLI